MSAISRSIGAIRATSKPGLTIWPSATGNPFWSRASWSTTPAMGVVMRVFSSVSWLCSKASSASSYVTSVRRYSSSAMSPCSNSIWRRFISASAFSRCRRVASRPAARRASSPVISATSCPLVTVDPSTRREPVASRASTRKPGVSTFRTTFSRVRSVPVVTMRSSTTSVVTSATSTGIRNSTAAVSVPPAQPVTASNSRPSGSSETDGRTRVIRWRI